MSDDLEQRVQKLEAQRIDDAKRIQDLERRLKFHDEQAKTQAQNVEAAGEAVSDLTKRFDEKFDAVPDAIRAKIEGTGQQ